MRTCPPLDPSTRMCRGRHFRCWWNGSHLEHIPDRSWLNFYRVLDWHWQLTCKSLDSKIIIAFVVCKSLTLYILLSLCTCLEPQSCLLGKQPAEDGNILRCTPQVWVHAGYCVLIASHLPHSQASTNSYDKGLPNFRPVSHKVGWHPALWLTGRNCELSPLSYEWCQG